MEKHREENGQTKRKISAISNENSNEFAKYVDVLTDSHKNVIHSSSSSLDLSGSHIPEKVLSIIKDLLDLFSSNVPKDVAPNEDGDLRSPKRRKVGGFMEFDSVTSLSNNRSETKVGQSLVTPPAKTNGIFQSTPSSVISTQSSITSADSTSSMHCDGCCCSQKGSAAHQDTFGVHRQILQHREVKGVCDLVRSKLEPVLVKKVQKNAGLKLEEVTVESGLETAASIDLLKLFGASIPVLEEIGQRARNGAILLQEGLKKMDEGK